MGNINPGQRLRIFQVRSGPSVRRTLDQLQAFGVRIKPDFCTRVCASRVRDELEGPSESTDWICTPRAGVNVPETVFVSSF